MIKNMMLYRLTSLASIELLNSWIHLDDALSNHPAHLPAGSQWRGVGFTDPASGLRSDDSMVWAASEGSILFTVTFHERQLPGATIKEHVQSRVAKIEEREQRKIYRKEVAQIRDEVEAELLPRAFIKHSHVDMLVKGDLLIVGTSSAKRAEDCLDLLRGAMGSLNVRPIAYKIPAEQMLLQIARENTVENLCRGDQVKLVDLDKNTVVFKGVDLGEDEPQTYMTSGFNPTELLVTMGSTMQMKMTDQLIFKSIKFDDMVFDEAKADADGDPAALLDGNILVFGGAVRELINTLDDAFGEDAPKLVEGEPSIGSIVDSLMAPIKNGGELHINGELAASIPSRDTDDLNDDEFEEDDDL